MSKKVAKPAETQVSLALELRVDVELKGLAEACGGLGPYIDPFVKRLKVENSRVKEGEQTGIPQIPLLVTDRLSIVDVKALFTAVSGYSFLRAIMLHSCDIKDEGVLVVSEFIRKYKPTPDKNPFGVETLELPSCGITARGCVHLEKLFAENATIKTLNLDFNKIGKEGAQCLSNGLRWNSTLSQLSLEYCGIDSDGGPVVASIIKSSNVRTLSLMGNTLGDKGIVAVGRAMAVSSQLESINLADNCFGEKSEGVEGLCEGIEKCRTLTAINIDFNTLHPSSAQALLAVVQNCVQLTSVVVDERLEADVYRQMMDIVSSRNKSAKKKKAAPSKK
ncbi:hypothetical protein AGDE_12058 [Angomonas deanei]|uniref:Leucine Rich repeat, putative n=1 Tax=Angomonas deanei TaxID=59799 RepID=A0A7G2CHL3_9TRYP|nr:hypothetical protein AGDE_12058 [Angomonas deanei]CAD2219246.1 Leucine Rich repeat, putative [Angomonas deanei]|eukprot:EPY25025.1 hypothetical protein AGDE_12058 [Angomonas deanei]